MKHLLHLLCASSLVLLATSTSAFAWPFVKRTGGYFSPKLSIRFPQNIAFQSDTDRPLEMFGGGLALQQTTRDPSGNLTHTNVSLPLPDFDPYLSTDPAVSIVSGRGDVGDIDGDGDMDIVYTSTLRYGNGFEESQNVRIVSCRNNGNGTWTRIWQLKDINGPTSQAPEVKLADLDGDGDLDLIETYNGIRVRWNPGDGNFNGTPTVLITTPYPYTPDLEIADFDGNGWPDIAVISNVALNAATPYNLTGRITLLSNTAGAFTSSTVLTLSNVDRFQESFAADVNADGKPDLLTTRITGSTEMTWHRNTGSGFAAPVSLMTLTPAQAPETVAFMPGDMDGDGIVDIAFTTRAGEIQWLRGIGSGLFNPAAVLLSSSITPGEENNISLADRDGDGDLDVSMYGAFFENLAPHNAAFASDQPWTSTNPSGTVQLAVGDLNNDGRQDLVVTDPGNTRLRWYGGNGNGLNFPLSISTNSNAPLGVTTGDFNRDGRTDVAWTTPNNLTQALSTSANGSTWATTTAATMTGITRILAEDMDGDGDTDILSAAPSANILRIHSNNGSATVWSPQNVATGLSGVATFASGQLTPGGRPEIASLGTFAVDIHRNPAGSWSKTNIANPSMSTTSRVVIIAEIDDAFPGPETIFALNDNSIRYHNDAFGAGVNPQTLIVSPFPIKQLVATDWNGDGFNDLLVATDTGVVLYSGARTSDPSASPLALSAIPLVAGPAFQDIVVMNLDSDGFPDAVAVEASGQLHLLYNRSAAIDFNVTNNSTQHTAPGDTTRAVTVNGTYLPTAYTPIASIAPSKVSIRFRRSEVIAGGVDTPGTTMSNTEVSALVESLSIYKGGATIHSETPATTSGEHIMNMPPSALLALGAGVNTNSNFEVRVKLKPTAASSSVKRFYVDYFADNSRWTAIDAAGASDTSPQRLKEKAPYPGTLFVVVTSTALETWRTYHFTTSSNTGNAANDFDYDNDGLPNLVEYALGTDPKIATVALNEAKVLTLLPPANPASFVGYKLTLNNAAMADPKLKVTIQRSFNLGNDWVALSSRVGGSSWSGLTPVPTVAGDSTNHNFTTNLTGATTPKFFIRLIVEELP